MGGGIRYISWRWRHQPLASRDRCKMECKLVLLGYYVDLHEDTISTPDPEMLEVVNLINSPEFNPCCLTATLHSIQELRWRISHWVPTGRIWRWITESANQMMNFADSSNIWVRRHDWGKWASFWPVIQFARGHTSDHALRRQLFTGRFSELVGIRREVTLPSPNRTHRWFSGDATPICIGGGD